MMRIRGNLTLARALGLLAILSLPAVLVLGWWMLAVAVVLAVAAEVVRPREQSRGARRSGRRRKAR